MAFGLCIFGAFAKDHHDRGHGRDHHRHEYRHHDRCNRGVRTAADIVSLVGASLEILRGPQPVIVTQPEPVVVPQPVVQPVYYTIPAVNPLPPPPSPCYHYQYIRY